MTSVITVKYLVLFFFDEAKHIAVSGGLLIEKSSVFGYDLPGYKITSLGLINEHIKFLT